MRISSRVSAIACAILGAIGSVDCSSKSDYDSESHFLCSYDRDCEHFVGRPLCVARKCVPPDAGQSGGRGNHGGAPDAGDAGATSTGGNGGGAGGAASDAGNGGAGGVVTDAGNGGAGGAVSGGTGGTIAPSDAGPRSDAPHDASVADAWRLPPGLAPIVAFITDGALGFRFVKVDPATGSELLSVAAPGVELIANGISAYDPATNTYFVLAQTQGPPSAQFLVSVDADTGSVRAQPQVGMELVSIAVTTSGAVVGARVANGIGNFDFGSIDRETGAFTVITTLSDAAPFQGEYAIDAPRNRFFELVGRAHLGTDIVVLDATTGATLFDAKTDVPVHDIEVDAQGRVFGYTVHAGISDIDLRRVDPATGTTTVVTTFPYLGLFNGGSGIDRIAGIIYHMYVSSGARGLLAIELSTGRTTTVPLAHEITTFEVCSACGAVNDPD